MESSLRKILTPTSSLDLLREIDAVASPSALSLQKRRPYVISVVGVNGVGKSTNLSKICFFLLQNKYKVLIVACDTFRSGAVEQLAVHVKNLQELTDREGGIVDLYQKGYGKDAANVAKDAVAFADQQGFDVVLIDTAGRRHNDQRLMSNLEKFAKFSNPDKILMVGEVSPFPAHSRTLLTVLGTGGNRFRLSSSQLQRSIREWKTAGWLHYIEVRHGGRYGRDFGQYGACDECACPVCWRRTALQ